MIETPTAAATAPAATSPSLTERVRDTFFAPRRLFASLGNDTSFGAVLVIATIIAIVAVAAEPAEYFLAQMEDPVNRRGAPVEITSPPEQIVLWGRAMAVLSAIVGHPLLALAGAGLLTILFRAVGGGGGQYRRYLVVATHGLLISSVGMFVAVLLRMLSGNVDAMPTVGMLLGVAPGGIVADILHGINLFTLWMLSVVAFGVAAIEPRVTPRGAAALLWGVYGVILVTLAVLFRA